MAATSLTSRPKRLTCNSIVYIIQLGTTLDDKSVDLMPVTLW